jgi:hypothetical protein
MGLVSAQGTGRSRYVYSNAVTQGETWILDSPEGVCAGQVRFEYAATFVLFSMRSRPVIGAPPNRSRMGG